MVTPNIGSAWATKVQSLHDLIQNPVVRAQVSESAWRKLFEYVRGEARERLAEHGVNAASAQKDGDAYVQNVLELVDWIFAALPTPATRKEVTDLAETAQTAVRELALALAPDDKERRFEVAGASPGTHTTLAIAQRRALLTSSPAVSVGDDTVEAGVGSAFLSRLRAARTPEQDSVAVTFVAFARNIFEALDKNAGLHGRAQVASVRFFDDSGARVHLSGDERVELGFALLPELQFDAAESHAECVHFSGEWRDDACEARSLSTGAALCACRSEGDYYGVRVAAGAPLNLPPGEQPLAGTVAPAISSSAFLEFWQWVLIIMLLLCWLLLCIAGLLTLYRRQRRPLDDMDSLQPYLDRTAGVGVLGALLATNADSVTSSSEMEMRDVWHYAANHDTMSESELGNLHDDFSWGLSGETMTTESEYTSQTLSELGIGASVTESELGGVVSRGGADASSSSSSRSTATRTKRKKLRTNVPLGSESMSGTLR